MSTDNRTPAERRYDNLKTGTVYIKPETADDDEIEIAEWCDRVIAEHRRQAITVERHTLHTDGSIPSDPWTTYTLGEASIALQDAGGGNVCVDGEMLDIEDAAQLRDLAALLTDPRVREALGKAD